MQNHILIVEDSLTMRRIIMNILGEMDIKNIEQAATVPDAKNILVEKRKIDIILCDWNLDGNLTGFDLLRDLRKDPRYSKEKLQIIMVTSESGKAEVVTALRAGASDYLVKPFANETLKSKIVVASQELAEHSGLSK
jgi:two-component system chemotaxis response regulator CheY